MNSLIVLTKLQIKGMLSSFNIKKDRGSSLTPIILICLIGFVFISKSLGLTILFLKNGLRDYILIYQAINVSVVFLIISFLRSDLLFEIKDFNVLRTLPLNIKIIIMSKLLSVYLIGLSLTAIAMFSSSIFLYSNNLISFLLIIKLIILVPFIPIYPMFIGLISGLAISLLDVLFKFKRVFRIIFSVFFVAGIVVFSIKNPNKDLIFEFSMLIKENINKFILILPQIKYLSKSIQDNSIINTLFFIIVSLAPTILYFIFLEKYYDKIREKLNYKSLNKKFNISEIKRHSKLVSLYMKELKLFKNSTTYLFNSGFSVILLIALSFLSVFFGIGKVLSFAKLEFLEDRIKFYFPYVISAFILTSCSTSSAISIEGKNLWQLKTLPIKKEQIYNSKILLNMSYHLIGILTSVILIGWQLKLKLSMVLMSLIIPVVYSFFVSVLGLFINLKFPKFDWNTETEVVKQSKSSFISNLLNMGMILINYGFINIMINIGKANYVYIFPIFIFLISLIIYKRICKDKNIFN